MAGTSCKCCRASAAWCRAIAAPTRTCQPRWARFPWGQDFVDVLTAAGLVEADEPAIDAGRRLSLQRADARFPGRRPRRPRDATGIIEATASCCSTSTTATRTSRRSAARSPRAMGSCCRWSSTARWSCCCCSPRAWRGCSQYRSSRRHRPSNRSRARRLPRFVVVEPLRDVPAPTPPPKAEVSDLDRRGGGARR